jgi:geranylgeranyl reductase
VSDEQRVQGFKGSRVQGRSKKGGLSRAMKLNTKVLVVGGGPAGATAGRLLAESGKDIILLERNLSYAKPCGGGIALNVFDEFNISKTLVKKKVQSLRIISPWGNRVEIGLNGHGLAIVERREFDEALRQSAEAQGARIIEGDFLRVLDDKKCRVETHIGQEKVEIVSDYIIAADGVNSRVRTSLGIKPPPTLLTISERIPGPDVDYCEFWFGSSQSPYFYSWVFPARDGFSIGTAVFEPRKINDLFQQFKARAGLVSEGERKVYRIPVWKGELYNINKILFAGDSAGQVLPLSYEGIYYAMKAGEMAARALLEEKVGNYKKMWKSRFQKRFILMDKLKNYFSKNDNSAEKLIALHRRPEVQEASLLLWLRKDNSRQSLLHYLKLFGKFLH